jgi:hypothetical protein
MATKKSAGAGRGFVNPQRTDERDEDYITPKQRMDMETEAADRKSSAAAEAAYNKVSGLKRGGSVGSASKRADGIAKTGKTRGTMITMCGGGMSKK